MKRRTALAFTILGGCSLAGLHLRAQSPSQPLAFEVASVKPDQSGSTAFRILYQADGRFTATSTTLFALIASAYQPITASQIVGAPSWIAVDRFNIQARASEGTVSTPNQMFPMLRTLLAERFKVAVHNDELPVYELVMAREDRKPGSGLHPVMVDCAGLRASFATSPTARPPCAIGGGSGVLVGGAATMAQLTSILANRVNRVVTDRTGLAGTFDFGLTYAADPTSVSGAISDSQSIFTAVQEQLGLKLESARGRVNVLVIDQVERPTED